MKGDYRPALPYNERDGYGFLGAEHMALGRKTGGRATGTPNKGTVAVAERLETIGCDPIEGMARIAMDIKTPIDIRAKLFSELAQYIAPKRKAIEHTGQSTGVGADARGYRQPHEGPTARGRYGTTVKLYTCPAISDGHSANVRREATRADRDTSVCRRPTGRMLGPWRRRGMARTDQTPA
jgi:hypothetical protein